MKNLFRITLLLLLLVYYLISLDITYCEDLTQHIEIESEIWEIQSNNQKTKIFTGIIIGLIILYGGYKLYELFINSNISPSQIILDQINNISSDDNVSINSDSSRFDSENSENYDYLEDSENSDSENSENSDSENSENYDYLEDSENSDSEDENGCLSQNTIKKHIDKETIPHGFDEKVFAEMAREYMRAHTYKPDHMGLIEWAIELSLKPLTPIQQLNIDYFDDLINNISSAEMRTHIANKTNPDNIPEEIFYLEKLKFLSDVEEKFDYMTWDQWYEELAKYRI